MWVIQLYVNRRPFFHITNDAHVVVQIIKGARPEMPAITGTFADVLRPLIITCWNGTPSTRPNANMVVDALRQSTTKEEFKDGLNDVSLSISAFGGGGDIFSSAMAGLTTSVSYIHMNNVTAPVDGGGRQSRATLALVRGRIFPEVQGGSLFPSFDSSSPRGTLPLHHHPEGAPESWNWGLGLLL